ncbi:uncharacterized protein [Typha latifolia]|uniref:uncharacterized protein n=1 Tax=Typha latifolia TaxID=4733 RepID=UPI003C304AAC
MALGKLTIVIGAGIVGSILTKEGNFPNIGGIFFNTLKIVTKHLQQDKEVPQSTGGPRADSLLAQVNNLRQELQFLASSRSVTIVTGSRSGSGAYSVTTVIVVGAVGYGYIRWKGWKLSDMMFVTRRSLSNACTAVGKQLEQISSSITATKRHLSSRIERVDCRLDECKELTAATKEEVTIMHGDLSTFQEEMQSVHLVVQNLETKLGRLELSQDLTTRGIYDLCKFANKLEQRHNVEVIQASSPSCQTIESSQSLPVAWTGSLPPLPLEPQSPSASPSTAVATPKVLRSSTTISASGLKELQGISNAVTAGFSRSNSMKADVSQFSNGASSSTESSSDTSSSNRFGWKFPSISVLTRTRTSS